MIKTEDAAGVYPPSEDSFLLLEAVRYAKGDVLDLFAGSGIVGLSAAKKADNVVLADINENAIKSINRNAELNRITNYKAVKSNFFSKLGGRRFDVIYMNPPYLPGARREGDELDAATLGGENGYEITISAINELKRHLKPDGVAFLILSDVYEVSKVYKALESINFKFKVVDTKKFFFEELILVRIYEKRGHSPYKR
ncbi:MAG: methyltransferase [Candidatus Parvarchaeota archaeon]|nr:methyltransferase [Candidatus Parvarchaeota archaeon]